MACRCQKILPLCNVSVCDVIDFGIQAQKEGEHRLVLSYLGIEFTKLASFGVGQQIIFPASGLNENYTYTGTLFEPDGNQIVIQSGEIEYDCFSFQTTLAFAIDEPADGSTS